jgi:hypothetical protein
VLAEVAGEACDTADGFSLSPSFDAEQAASATPRASKPARRQIRPFTDVLFSFMVSSSWIHRFRNAL